MDKEKIIAKVKARLAAQKKFHWGSYWGTWNRNLGEKDGWFIELDLTPINQNWEKGRIQDERIRVHLTSRDSKDKDVDKLPEDILEKMEENLGKSAVNKLLNFDYIGDMGGLDKFLEAHKEAIKDPGHRGGGIPYKKIKKHKKD
jgi:hypothetical protein